MEPIMNKFIRRLSLMAALLSLISTASAGNGLLDIEVNENQAAEQRPSSEMEMAPIDDMVIKHGELLELDARSYAVAKMRSGKMVTMDRELLDLSHPSRGMNKDAVMEKFGAPISTRPAVGKPPISSWVYADYTVYFEFEWVLHSVLNK